MNCCQCQGVEAVFDDKIARRELKRYRRQGPNKETRMLLDALMSEGVEGLTLLDIGGGVGAVHHELLAAGVAHATDVDAASNYIAAARRESEERGHADRVTYHHGNFVDLASDIERADIVTLDRVICCYHDMRALVGLSAQHAGQLYGAVFPRDRWWIKVGLVLGNFLLWLSRSQFRSFAHPTGAVDAELRRHGLERRFHAEASLMWQVVVYRRNGGP